MRALVFAVSYRSVKLLQRGFMSNLLGHTFVSRADGLVLCEALASRRLLLKQAGYMRSA